MVYEDAVVVHVFRVTQRVRKTVSLEECVNRRLFHREAAGAAQVITVRSRRMVLPANLVVIANVVENVIEEFLTNDETSPHEHRRDEHCNNAPTVFASLEQRPSKHNNRHATHGCHAKDDVRGNKSYA